MSNMARSPISYIIILYLSLQLVYVSIKVLLVNRQIRVDDFTYLVFEVFKLLKDLIMSHIQIFTLFLTLDLEVMNISLKNHVLI